MVALPAGATASLLQCSFLFIAIAEHADHSRLGEPANLENIGSLLAYVGISSQALTAVLRSLASLQFFFLIPIHKTNKVEIYLHGYVALNGTV